MEPKKRLTPLFTIKYSHLPTIQEYSDESHISILEQPVISNRGSEFRRIINLLIKLSNEMVCKIQKIESHASDLQGQIALLESLQKYARDKIDDNQDIFGIF
ncbi:hypothetical protein SS50377_20554 [Spironucleus salmonicida]|uniref:Uncharacterized protein n=1 Tax=Spironucleus salmonicida TaxID=348837 RepID=A0A9P8LZC6_9EUKA|nr:hypothetical protein SS50377_20554 [Spironucleus salmonicida]